MASSLGEANLRRGERPRGLCPCNARPSRNACNRARHHRLGRRDGARSRVRADDFPQLREARSGQRSKSASCFEGAPGWSFGTPQWPPEWSESFGNRSGTLDPSGCGCYKHSKSKYGAVAQLGERLNGIQEVDGSIPFSSTRSLGFPDPLFPDPLLEQRNGNDIRHRFPPWMTFRSRPCCAFATASGLV